MAKWNLNDEFVQFFYLQSFYFVRFLRSFFFCRTQKPEDLISALCLDNDENSTYPKCIPFEKLTVESSLFWCSLIAFFQQDERRSDDLELVIPELSIFCGYVEKCEMKILKLKQSPSNKRIFYQIQRHNNQRGKGTVGNHNCTEHFVQSYRDFNQF